MLWEQETAVDYMKGICFILKEVDMGEWSVVRGEG